MITLGKEIQDLLLGKPVSFDLSLVALETLSLFHQRVLRAESRVPRGRVTTYGCLATHLGLPGAARAVGWALSHNPFPLIIPCHRTIKSTGDLGGFGGEFPSQGDLRGLKQVLLTREGIPVPSTGRLPLSTLKRYLYDRY